MAKVSKIIVDKAVLVNTGNYENVRIGYAEEVTLEEGDDAKAERTRATERVDNVLRDEVDAIELKTRRANSKAGRFGI